MVDFDRSAFVAKFQEEAADLLQRLNEGVITLEAQPDDKPLIDQMLRDAHTLKGASRMVGLIDISNIAHRLEDIMVKIRDGDLTYTPKMSDDFFEALDAIVYLVENGGENADDALDLDALQVKLSAVAGEGQTDAAAGATAAAAAPASGPAEKAGAPVDAGAVTTASDAEPGPAGGREGGEDAGVGDDEDGGDADEDAGTAASSDAAESAGHTRSSGSSAAAGLKAKTQTTIRIRTEQVDRLLNLISETVIAQIKSEQRLSELRMQGNELAETWSAWLRLRAELSAVADTEQMNALETALNAVDSLLVDSRHMANAFVKDYGEDVSRAGVVVNDLQEQAMALRMLPANTIFQTFPRAMRDLAKQFRKDVDLIIEGGETELDKKVLEEINDPLIHIMRNAVDHGIEDPQTREQRGKPATGTIRLSARQEGDRIIIEIADDGGGIDPERVKAAAIRKGYLTEAEARSMSDREAIYLIFEAGFSTAAIITEISGRGVGMDVVREFVVEKLKGSIDVQSELGKGTTFRMAIPLTLAIIRALLLNCGDQVFALPTSSIEETLRVDPTEIIKAEGREVIRRQRRTIPVVRLASILDVAETDRESAKVPIVTIGFSGQRMGFIVDGFIGEQQIVIKPLGSHLQKVDNIAGVTVLGAGEIVPILNVPDLMSNARMRAGTRMGPVVREEHEGARRVLICEDSFTTRELERSIFEAAGYEVETAVDGQEGLTMLREGARVDAVVTDVQMPRMTGFQLTRAIKGDKQLKEIPVVIVTSLERDEEKAEGIQAGADAYITKSVFNQDTLLDTVERLIR
jgi:two-component system, chemotaxis family, sensor kinase CheA